MVRTFIFTLVIITSTWGCAAGPPSAIFTPIEVKAPVPIPVYCKVGKLAKPELPIAVLKGDSAPADTIRAYAATVAILKGAIRERDLAIEGCAAPSDQGQTPRPRSAPPAAGEGVK